MSAKLTMSDKNKKFWDSPKNKQRVAIAKDVLKQLASKEIKATSGIYFRVYGLKKDIINVPNKLDSLLSLFKKINAKCDVCGIGACFFSLVRMGNNVKTESFIGGDISIENYDSGDTFVMRKNLRKVFSSEQITLIECAFEIEDCHTDLTYVDFFKKQDAVEFGRQYKSESTRLEAIMRNIIKNKGTFIP